MMRGLGWGTYRYELVTVTAPGFCDADCSRRSLCHSAACHERCDVWNEGAARRWHHLTVMLRRYFPRAEVEFFKVWEEQKRGALHAHFLARTRGFRLPPSAWRRLAVRAGFGPVLDVEPASGIGAAAYLAKYLSKDSTRTNVRVPWSVSGGWYFRVHGPWAEEFGGMWRVRDRHAPGTSPWYLVPRPPEPRSQPGSIGVDAGYWQPP